MAGGDPRFRSQPTQPEGILQSQRNLPLCHTVLAQEASDKIRQPSGIRIGREPVPINLPGRNSLISLPLFTARRYVKIFLISQST